MQSSSARVGAQVMVLPAPASDCAVQSPNPHRVDAVRKRLLSDELYVDIAETFRALADSTRAKIVHALTDQSLCVGDLAQVVGVSEPAVSQHLRLLRTLRIVRGRRMGKMVFYSLEDAHVRSLLTMVLGHQREQAPPATSSLLR